MSVGNNTIRPVDTANTPAILTTAGDILSANEKRSGFMIQNVGTNDVFIRLGTGASTTVFHMVLKGGTADNDGMGGSLSIMSPIFKGVVSMAGTTPKVVVTEL